MSAGSAGSADTFVARFADRREGALTGAPGPGKPGCHRYGHLCLQIVVGEAGRRRTRRHQVRTRGQGPGDVRHHRPEASAEPVADHGATGPAFRPRKYATRGSLSPPTTAKVTVMWPRLVRGPCRSASNVARSRIRQATGAPPPSRGEAVAAFEPACPEDRPPGTSGHPVPKPVVLGPFPGVGLVSPLHSLVLFARRPGCSAGSSAGAPCTQVPAPSAWAIHARRVPVGPPGRPCPSSCQARQITAVSGRASPCDPSGRGRREQPQQGPSAPLAAHVPTGVPFDATGRATRGERHRAQRQRSAATKGPPSPGPPDTTNRPWVGGRATSRNNPHMWICLWTDSAAGRRRPW